MASTAAKAAYSPITKPLTNPTAVVPQPVESDTSSLGMRACMETIAAEAAQQARSGIHAELEALRVEVRLANEGLDTKLELALNPACAHSRPTLPG